MAARTVEYEPATGVPPEYVEFLPKQDVVAALPGSWTAAAGRAGTGIWAAVDRA